MAFALGRRPGLALGLLGLPLGVGTLPVVEGALLLLDLLIGEAPFRKRMPAPEPSDPIRPRRRNV